MYFLELPRQGDSKNYTKTFVSLKNKMGISMKKYSIDKIDVITNFAVITNVVIKRVHCTNAQERLLQYPRHWCWHCWR